MTENTSTRRVRTRPQRKKTRDRRAFGDGLREWLAKREQIAATKRRNAAKPSTSGRGVERVPAHLRSTPRPVEYLVKHEPVQHPWSGRWVKGLPHMRAERDEKSRKSGRLRKELR